MSIPAAGELEVLPAGSLAADLGPQQSAELGTQAGHVRRSPIRRTLEQSLPAKGDVDDQGLRRSMLASAVFLLAGLGGAVGGHVTDKVTPAAVAFVALLILGALVALVLDHLTGERETAEPPDRSAALIVDARWAHAVQIGNQNVQVNQNEPPVDAGRDTP